MSLFARLMVLVLLAAIPVVGFEAYHERLLREQQWAEVAQDAERILHLVDSEQRRLAEGVRQVLITLSQIPTIRRQDVPACQALLDNLRPEYPDHFHVQVTDRKGSILCATNAEAVGTSMAAGLHFRQALAGARFTIGTHIRRTSPDETLLPFAAPYRGPDGSTAGVVAATLSLGWLKSYLAERALPRYADLVLADRDGTVLVRVPERSDLIGKPLPDRFRRLMAGQRDGTVEIEGLDGVTRLTAYSSPIHHRNIFIAVGIDGQAAMAASTAGPARPLVGLAAMLALMLAAVWWGGHHFIRRPIRVLVETIRRWQRGDRTARASLADRRSEIGILGEAFDTMADALDAEIRARERIHTAVQAAEARLRAVVETATDAMVVIDENGTIRSFNPAAERIFGYAAADAIGRNVSLLMPEPDRSRHDGYIRHYLETGVRRIIGIGREVEGRRRDGTSFPLDLSIAEWSVGGERFFTGIMRDISRRRQVEQEHRAMNEALRQSEERLNLALSSAHAGSWDLDLRTHRVTWSEQTYRLFGLRPGQTVRHEDWVNAIHPDDRARAEERFRRTLAERRAEYRSEFRIIHPEGGIRWLEGIGRVSFAADGTPLRMTGLNIDITERKLLEQELRRAKAIAEEASLAKTKFLAAASHDLRQPVQSMLLFASTLRGHIHDEPGRANLAHLERSMEVLKGLLDSLLDVSRLDAGLIEPRIRDLALQPLLSDLDIAYAPVAASKGLEWHVAATPHRVRSDPDLFGRMLRNLVENALRYTQKGFVRIDCQETGGEVRIAVRDSGVGIPSDHLERIWDEFHQVGNPERDREQGLGLGLAIVQRLAKLLGHEVAMESVPGEGSVFTITAPVAVSASDEAGAQAPVSAPAAGTGRLVLVVDDDAIVRDALAAILRAWGYDVLSVGSTEEAVEQVGKAGCTPDVIMADYRLRGARVGTEAILRIRDLVGASVPGVILTGETGPEAHRDAKLHGLAVIHKPATPHQLDRVLGRLVQGHTAGIVEPGSS